MTNKDGETVTEFEKMRSNTPYFSISIENDKNVKGEMAVDMAHRPEFTGFNFGIIKVPQTNIEINKIITNVKLTNTVGSVLEQGNPKLTRNYITALDALEKGSKYVRAEMTSESIYGSTIETTYEITITNNSEKDYIEDNGNPNYGYYFKYGDKGNAYLKQTIVEEVKDEIDADYDIASSNLTETVYHPDGSRESAGQSVKKEVTMKAEEDHINFNGWSGLESGGTSTIEYKASGRFQEDMDLQYDNKAKIVSMQLDAGATLQSGYKWGTYSSTTIAVMPDTGENRSLTYIIVAAVALVTVIIGIVIIKKKVLK